MRGRFVMLFGAVALFAACDNSSPVSPATPNEAADVIDIVPDYAVSPAASLDAAGIGSLIHYPIPPHLQQAYADLGLPRGSFPLAETLAETVLSLPMGAQLSLETVDEVAATVRGYMLRSGAE